MPWDDNLSHGSIAYRIASAQDERLRIIAGPGTGKSFALKRRVARLLDEGIDPRRILPVTFTRIAAEDLHRELVGLDVPRADELHGRTLHSLGLWILRRRHVLETTGRIARPLNDFEVDPLLYDLSEDFGDKRAKRERIRAYESAWARLQHEEPGFAQENTDVAFEGQLTNWLRFHNAMLIGEIIPEVYRYLRDNPAARERELFDHVLIDEFQDLNKAEQRVLEMLGEESHLCIVGDDDQSIYSFKHANPEGIREWHEGHDDVADHQLSQCRRCPTRVVRVANALIAHNVDREQRQLDEIADNGEGRIAVWQYGSLDEEIAGVSNLVADLIGNREVPAGDILILAQRKVIGNPIFDNLRTAGIPVKSYYQEAEIDSSIAQERLALLKLLVNNEDRVALRWLIGLGSNDFRANAYRRIRSHCDHTGMSPWEALNALDEGELRIPHTASLIRRFREIQVELTRLSGIVDLEEFVEEWTPPDEPEVSQLRELALRSLDTCDTRETLLESVIQEISQPEIPLEVAEVRIMSLHKSKGLSSPIVIIAGCVDGVLPIEPNGNLPQAQRRALIEEQRRLFYVGITRVKADPDEGKPGRLYLTSSLTWPQRDALGAGASPARMRRGIAHFNASRFLGELGPAAPRPQRR